MSLHGLEEAKKPLLPGRAKHINSAAIEFASAKNMHSLKRFQVLDKIMFLLIVKPEIESRIVAVDHIEQRLEATIMVEAPFIGRKHK